MRHVELRAGLYRDSVELMRISARLASAPGVEQALVAMATPVNLGLLAELDLPAPAGASPSDLMVALRTRDDESRAAALAQLESLLHNQSAATVSTSEAEAVPRTTASAARRLTGALTLVSTPGPYAFLEAMDALEAGRSVMVFSDNVPVEQELVLKRLARDKGLLVMGPDCGTAVVAGVGLGFANVVRPGPVGIVAASGTGAQQVMALLAAAGVGISHCLGVGGRDLSDVVDALSTHTALDVLDADPETRFIIVLGKPPSPRVADEVRSHAAGLGTPCLVAPLGPDAPDLTAVVAEVLTRLDVQVPQWPHRAPVETAWRPVPGPLSPSPVTPGWLRGLYGGGTLCAEAQAVAAPLLGSPVLSNVPLRPEWSLPPDGTESGHILLDLGADEFTVGRPHPMLDPAARLPLMRRWSADPEVSVILLDVVLGNGSHPDPASVLAPAVIEALARPEPLAVVVSMVGTRDDPQDSTRQSAALAKAGARVFGSNAEAARHAAALASGATP